jgi:hypothetical protein
MADDRDVLETLKFELRFLEDGGYGRRPTQAWRPPLVIEDSPTCLNFNMPERPHPCSECFLIQFVPQDKKDLPSPCRHIPLDEKGQTIDTLCRTASQAELEEIYGGWLRRTIRQLEAERAARGGSAA